MAKHEFGILPQTPASGERYDAYEPEKYTLIAVDDVLLEPLLPKLSAIPCFCHTLDVPCQGLVYAGITLIPPESLDAMAGIFKGIPAFSALTALLLQAKAANQFVIHYGL